MRLAIVVLVSVALLGGGSWVYMNLVNPPALEVAQEYVQALVSQDFASVVAMYHDEHPSPTVIELVAAHASFAEAFALTGIELTALDTVEESWQEAKYQFELLYTSKYFEPLTVAMTLDLSRQDFFNWKVIWSDQFPLPEYGIKAVYSRSRLEPQRGSIYDRYGNLLAGGGSKVAIGVQPGRISDPEQLHQVLQETLQLDRNFVQSKYQAPGIQDHWFVPLKIVSEEEYSRLDPILRPIPGIFFRREEARVYPGAATTSHLTGYIGEADREMIEKHPERDYLVGERAGLSGLEYGQEELLRGRPGYQFVVTAEDGSMEMLAERPVEHGQDIHLTLDLPMQEQAVQVLGAQRGSVVVIDAHSGEVLVLASTPGYDPNEFIGGISQARWEELSSDPTLPMFNRALQGRYPPGSVFKVITAASALELGHFAPDSIFVDSGELMVEGNVIRNFEREVFDEHIFQEAIVHSINTTMAKVGLKVGANALASYFTRWQLDRQPDLGLPARAGQIGHPSRSRVTLAWSAIGQAEVLLTPFHMASLFAAFPTSGSLPDFHLIRGRSQDRQYEVMLPDTAAEMAQMLEKVVQEGTGKAAFVEGLRIRGKTGTAEVGNDKNHAWFAGWVEDIHGRDLAFAFLVEEGGVGGRDAAPLAAEFWRQVSELGQITN